MNSTKKRSLIPALVLALVSVALPACRHREGPLREEHSKIVVTSPKVADVTLTQQYVCQIHSQRHIEVCTLEEGYLQSLPISEGQAVKEGELMFKLVPALYQARLDAELAEVQLAQQEYNNTSRLVQDKVVSERELVLYQAKLAKAQAKAELAKTELNFTEVKAPFDGIVDRLREQQGSLVKDGDVLTTLSDNRVLWVYFNVPEARYLDYMAGRGQDPEIEVVELVLADGSKFKHTGKVAAIEGQFNNETGTIPFRADFPNPDGLLRHGQTGNVLLHRTQSAALVIPQRATFEVLNKRYVYVVDDDHVVHQREITVLHEKDDIFLVGKGLGAGDRFVLEGVRQVQGGGKVEYEYRNPDEALAHQKYHAE